MRLGLVGLGPWGQIYARTIAKRADCAIVAYARSSDREDGVPPGARRVAGGEGLIAAVLAGDLDGLLVATAPAHQAELALACAHTRVPALIEKPLGLAAADAQRVQDAVRAAADPAPLLVNHIHLQAPAFQRLLSLVRAAGEAGDPVVAISAAGHNTRPIRAFSSLYDYGPHDASMCLALVGPDAPLVVEPKDVRWVPLRDEPSAGLCEARVALGEVDLRLRMGLSDGPKTRSLRVRLRSGRELVYDDTQPQAAKLVDGGEAVPIGDALPLDAAIERYLSAIERWRSGSWGPVEAQADVHLSVRVNALLDALACHLQPA